MLDNAITLQLAQADQSDARSVSLIDTDNGKSVRIHKASGLTLTLTVANSVTNENSPFKTDRTLVRVDVSKASTLRPEIETKGSVYLVIAAPRGDGITISEVKNAWVAMLRFLGGLSATPSGVTSAVALTNASTLFDRLTAGEV